MPPTTTPLPTPLPDHPLASLLTVSCHLDLGCLGSLIKIAALASEIIRISARCWILELRHLKQLGMILLLHLEKVLAMGVIMRHCTRSGVSSGELAD